MPFRAEILGLFPEKCERARSLEQREIRMSRAGNRYVALGLLHVLTAVFVGASPDCRSMAGEAELSKVAETPDWGFRQGGRDLGPARLYTVHQPVQDAPYRVSIAGEVLPLEPAGTIVPAYYVRFHLQEPLTLSLNVELAPGETVNLQPARYRDDLEPNGRGLQLAIREPGARVIMRETETGERHTPLIILAESGAPWQGPPADRQLFDVSHLAGSGPGDPQTGALQAVLDACADSDQGGVVFFGPGVYHTRGLVVGSNTLVYLAPGAVVYASTREEDFPREFLLFRDAENSGLIGYGILDGNGHIVRGPRAERSMTLVRFLNSRNVRAENVLLRNAAGWTFHIIGCRDVQVDNVRVTGDWGVPNTDGINPDNSQNVRIRNAFIYAGDDPACVKATNRYGSQLPTRQIEIRDSTVMTLKTALKVGTESRQDIRQVRFENIDVIHSSRGIALWMRDGHTFSDIVFRDIRMDLLEFEGERMSGEPFRFCIQDRAGAGSIRDILVENVDVSAPFRAQFTGRPGGTLSGVVLRNVRWRLRPVYQKQQPLPLSAGWVVDPANELALEGNPLLVIHRAADFTFDNVTIDWSDVPDGPWDRVADLQDSQHIGLHTIRHRHKPFPRRSEGSDSR